MNSILYPKQNKPAQSRQDGESDLSGQSIVPSAELILQAAQIEDFRSVRTLENSDRFFRKYYSNNVHRQCSLIAKIIYGESNIIWGTAGHTASPVISYAFGSKSLLIPFTGMMHNVDLGLHLRRSLDLE